MFSRHEWYFSMYSAHFCDKKKIFVVLFEKREEKIRLDTRENKMKKNRFDNGYKISKSPIPR